MKLLAAILFISLLNLTYCNYHDELVALVLKTADSINSYVGSLEDLEAEIIKEVQNYPGPYKKHQVDSFTMSTCSKLKSSVINCDQFKKVINDSLRSGNKIIQ